MSISLHTKYQLRRIVREAVSDAMRKQEVSGPGSKLVSKMGITPQPIPGNGGGLEVMLIGVYEPGKTADAFFIDEDGKEYDFKTMRIPPSKKTSTGYPTEAYMKASGMDKFFKDAKIAAPAYCKSKGWEYLGTDESGYAYPHLAD